jgi:hypothetical protein
VLVIAAAMAIPTAAPRPGWRGSARGRGRAGHLRCRSRHLRRAGLEGRSVHLWRRAHPAIAAAETLCLRTRRGDLRLRARGLEACTIVAAVGSGLEARRRCTRLGTRHSHLGAPATAASLRLRLGRHCSRLPL